MMLSEKEGKLAIQLFEIGAVKFGSFKLKLHESNPQAPLSPIYVDLRILRSFPQVMDSAVKVYVDLTTGLTFDVYADVPTAATPIVAVMSHLTRVPMISPRKDEKGHGLSRKIDGVWKEGAIALLIDDLVTRADSKLEAISVLEENGLKVRDTVALLDRQQGGVDELKKRGYTCHTALKLTEVLDLYAKLGKINNEQFDKTMQYLGNS